MLIHAFLPEIYDLLGVYLALITVNCIILGRAEMFANKNTVVKSALDGVGMGLGFTLALFMISTIREVFGAGTFMGLEIPFMSFFKIPILAQSPGGYLVYGILIAVMNKLTEKKGGVKKKSFSCEGCPSASVCASKGACANANVEKEETVNG
jgi:electron transport complex protein RnfE